MGFASPDVREHVVASFFGHMAPYLDEKLLRLSAGALALAFGPGSANAVAAAAAGLSGSTVGTGMRDLQDADAPVGRIRRPGAGRRGIQQTCPGLWPALDALIEPEERGDPENPLRWTIKSTRTLADELTGQGFPVSHSVVGRLLRENGYSLRGTAKVLEGKAEHGPDRDAQFRHINESTKAFVATGQPVVSVDTKKKEPIGAFDNPGTTWRPNKDPGKVADHDFIGVDVPVAVSYGIYDVGADRGFVNVGVSRDTPAFAVASIRRWWETIGKNQYPDADRLLVVADSGGSNSARSLVFKVLLHQLAVEAGLTITVAHLPPGTSKWNKVEHRLFAQISSNWRGRPLTSLQVVVCSIAATRTRTGLTVECALDPGDYPIGQSGSRDEVEALPLTRNDFRGDWNYTIAPTPAAPVAHPRRPNAARAGTRYAAPTLIGNAAQRAAWANHLSIPAVTGMPDADWAALAGHLHAVYDQRELRIPMSHLMLAAVLHQRHRLPAAQISRLMDLHPTRLKQHAEHLAPLFAQHGHPLTTAGRTTRRLEDLLTLAPLPQQEDATREVTT